MGIQLPVELTISATTLEPIVETAQ